jgi:hypothetical protein
MREMESLMIPKICCPCFPGWVLDSSFYVSASIAKLAFIRDK